MNTLLSSRRAVTAGLRFFMLTAVVWGSATGARAISGASASASAGGNSDEGEGLISAHATASDAYVPTGLFDSSNSGYGSATVLVGVVRVAASGAGTFYGSGSGSATGRWFDQIVIDSPSLHGQLGEVTFSMVVHGSLGGSVIGEYGGTWAAHYSVSFDAVSASTLAQDSASVSGSAYYDSEFSGDPVPGLLTLTLPIIFGDPFTVNFMMTVGASGGGNGGSPSSGASAISDFGNTAYWNGFDRVTDELGETVSDWTVTSDSGVDFSMALIPEPGVYAAVFGVMALGLAAGRRRR
jgi:hypothetical protein